MHIYIPKGRDKLNKEKQKKEYIYIVPDVSRSPGHAPGAIFHPLPPGHRRLHEASAKESRGKIILTGSWLCRQRGGYCGEREMFGAVIADYDCMACPGGRWCWRTDEPRRVFQNALFLDVTGFGKSSGRRTKNTGQRPVWAGRKRVRRRRR